MALVESRADGASKQPRPGGAPGRPRTPENQPSSRQVAVDVGQVRGEIKAVGTGPSRGKEPARLAAVAKLMGQEQVHLIDLERGEPLVELPDQLAWRIRVVIGDQQDFLADLGHDLPRLRIVTFASVLPSIRRGSVGVFAD
jgi:hypothetical protein